MSGKGKAGEKKNSAKGKPGRGGREEGGVKKGSPKAGPQSFPRRRESREPVKGEGSRPHDGSQPARPVSREYLVPLFIVLACLAVYWQVGGHQFVSFDDPLYIKENRHVLAGLSWENVRWAFSFSEKDQTYWHPLTWLSHMADVQMWGVDAGMHHLTNVFFHVLNVVLLFFVLRMMTGEVWKSAFVASLFALHPVNVDSVAWVAERKNLLSTFFWLLVMVSYVWYARRPGMARYGLVVVFFVLGLLAKPMLMTLPFVLLLLDYWPLGRVRFGEAGFDGSPGVEGRKVGSVGELLLSPAVLDKVPLILISFVSIYLSMASLGVAENVVSTGDVPMVLRIENAIVSYVGYVWKLVWPYGLAVYYPFPKVIPVWKVLLSLVALAGVTVWAGLSYRKRPYFLVGWLWFAGTLVPVSGIVQGGLWPALADRWAYVPFMGLFIVAAWGVPEIARRLSLKKEVLAAASAAVLVILAASAWVQTGHWKDSLSLYDHALEVTGDNDIMAFNKGAWLLNKGDLGQAKEYFLKTLQINPHYVRGYSNLGFVLYKQGDFPNAVTAYNKAIEKAPHSRAALEAYNNYALLLIRRQDAGSLSEAVRLLTKALEIDPEYGEAHSNMGFALAMQGKAEDAVGHIEKAAHFSPFSARIYYNNGYILTKLGRKDEAVRYFEGAYRIDPSSVEGHDGMAMAFLAKGDAGSAVEHFRQALQIDPGDKVARKYLQRIMAGAAQPSD